MMMRRALVSFSVAVGLVFASLPVEAQNRPRSMSRPRAVQPEAKPEAKPEAAPILPQAEGAPPPYEPQLLRLAEIMGALTYLRDVCGMSDSQAWRGKMSALLEAEARTDFRKERLAGAYNRGFRGYELTYRVCTPNAQLIIRRFMDEGAKIARDITQRYNAS